ncbi:unnamed protein product [Diamesa hyperborea]
MKALSFILSLVLLDCALAARFRSDPWGTQVQRLQKPENYSDTEIMEDTVARDSKIVNGFTATLLNEFTYQGLIFIDRPTVKGNQCGASILSERWIVSAKHCVNDAISIEIRVGGLSRFTYAVRTYANSYAKSDTSDVALISMRDKVLFSNLLNYVRLPRISQKNNLYTGNIATVSGYGVDNQAAFTLSNNLQYTTVKVISNVECAETFGPAATGPTVICAVGYPNLKSSSCPGDSGGPIALNENGTSTLIGVISYGAAFGCDLGYPVGFFKTTEQLQWITSYTGIPLRP